MGLQRPTVLIGVAVTVLVVAVLVWLVFFTSPYTFRSDCRQIAPNGWECDNP